MKFRLRFLFILCALSCQEPISFGLEPFKLVVVDARVSNQPDASSVLIYQTFNSEITKKKRLSGFDVRFVSGSGEVFELAEGKDRGMYHPTPGFSAKIGESYLLEAVSPEGYHFQSSYDSVLPPVDFGFSVIDSTKLVFVETTRAFISEKIKAVVADVQPEKQSHQSRFVLHYEYEHHFTEDTLKSAPVDEFTLYACYDLASCSKNTRINVGSLSDRSWSFSPPNCPPRTDCSVKFEQYEIKLVVTQETLTNVSFKFWKDVERLVNNNGLIFDAAPFKLDGNVECSTCPFAVAGQFSAVSEVRKSVVITL